MSSATMTRDELKMALVDHGVDAGGATKKDDLIALYEEHVQEAMADAEFSCDDNEEMALSNLKKKKSTPKSSKKLNDESFVIGDFDVTKLTDDQLSEALIERGLEVGPIVGKCSLLKSLVTDNFNSCLSFLESTRKFYRKKLLASLRDEGLNGSKLDAEVATNGQDSLQNGEFSADDEEVNGSEESKESDKKSDDDQPAVVVKKAKQPVTPQTSPISSLRQRFMGKLSRNDCVSVECSHMSFFFQGHPKSRITKDSLQLRADQFTRTRSPKQPNRL